MTDTYVYTAANRTIAPYATTTAEMLTGAAASVSNLKPDPTNLQVSCRETPRRWEGGERRRGVEGVGS